MQEFTPVLYFVFLPVTVNWRRRVYNMANCGQVHLKVFQKSSMLCQTHTLFPSVYQSIFLLLSQKRFLTSSLAVPTDPTRNQTNLRNWICWRHLTTNNHVLWVM